MDKWVGKVAVVTGASSGIGAAIVEALAEEGVVVVGLARRLALIQELASKHKNAKGKIHPLECDVTDQGSISRAFDWIEGKLGGVDILINNAGITRMGRFFDLTKPDTDYLSVVDTNLKGVLLVSRRAFKTMQKKDCGYIINMNSIVGQGTVQSFDVTAGMNVYRPTKHAITQLSTLMRMEFTTSGNNIRVTSISPGAVKTEIDKAGGMRVDGKAIWDSMPHLQASDISDQVVHVLSSKPNVNISELTIEPLGGFLENVKLT